MLNQLAPFNQHELDRCMQWFVKKHGPLTQYLMVKLHVMSDVFSVLDKGMPIIGGPLLKWELGPTVPSAWGWLKRQAKLYEQGDERASFVVQETGRKAELYSLPEGAAVDEDEFSPAEVRAMSRAWDEIGELSWQDSQDYFHVPNFFMGKAWTDAGIRNAPIDWNAIIDAFDSERSEDHTHIKTLLAIGI